MIDLKAPLPWLLGSLLLAVIATNLAWLATRWTARRRIAAVLPALGWLAVSLFYLLPPAVAWQRGALSLYWLGIAEIDWVASLTAGAPLVALMGAMLVFGWLVYRRSLPNGRSTEPRTAHAALALRGVVDAALLQWHWAFYRTLAIGALASGAAPIGLSKESMYWGTWLSAGAAAAEWALNPYARAALRREGSREAALRQAVLALGTAALFLLTRNFYLGLILHLAVETLIAGWFPLPMSTTTKPQYSGTNTGA